MLNKSKKYAENNTKQKRKISRTRIIIFKKVRRPYKKLCCVVNNNGNTVHFNYTRGTRKLFLIFIA